MILVELWQQYFVVAAKYIMSIWSILGSDSVDGVSVVSSLTVRLPEPVDIFVLV